MLRLFHSYFKLTHLAVFLCSMGFTQTHFKHITAVVQLYGLNTSCGPLEIYVAVDGENQT